MYAVFIGKISKYCFNTEKKNVYMYFFLSPTQDGSFWGCLRIGWRAGKKPPPPTLLNLKPATHIPEW